MDISDLLIQQQGSRRSHSSGCLSIMTGVVKENYNENFPGKVRVEFFFGEEGKTSSEWVRVMQPYCGKEYGDYFIPEINTEVVLGFNLGNINKPVVLGCLWNDVDTIPKEVANKDNSIKCIRTKGGHEILFDETKDAEKIRIRTNKKLTIQLEDKEEKISIQDEKGENLLSMDCKNGEIRLKAKKKLVFSAGDKDMLTLDGTGKKASLEADNIEISATQAIKLKGQNASLEGNSMLELKSSGNIKAQASALVELKGAMVKIN